MLGENAKGALLYQIAIKLKLDPKQLSSKSLEVAESLHTILGNQGYTFVEGLIIREIKVTFDIPLKDGSSFAQAVSEARQKFLS